MFLDTQNLNEADSKALAIGATLYHDFILADELFSRYYFSKPGLELAHYMVDLESFTGLERPNSIHPDLTVIGEATK